MKKIWICKNSDGLTRLTNEKPVWNEKYGVWQGNIHTASWFSVPASITKLERGECREVSGITLTKDKHLFEQIKG